MFLQSENTVEQVWYMHCSRPLLSAKEGYQTRNHTLEKINQMELMELVLKRERSEVSDRFRKQKQNANNLKSTARELNWPTRLPLGNYHTLESSTYSRVKLSLAIKLILSLLQLLSKRLRFNICKFYTVVIKTYGFISLQCKIRNQNIDLHVSSHSFSLKASEDALWLRHNHL